MSTPSSASESGSGNAGPSTAGVMLPVAVPPVLPPATASTRAPRDNSRVTFNANNSGVASAPREAMSARETKAHGTPRLLRAGSTPGHHLSGDSGVATASGAAHSSPDGADEQGVASRRGDDEPSVGITPEVTRLVFDDAELAPSGAVAGAAGGGGLAAVLAALRKENETLKLERRKDARHIEEVRC